MIIDNDLKNIRSHKATGLESFTVRIDNCECVLVNYWLKGRNQGVDREDHGVVWDVSILPGVLLTAALASSPKENDSLVCGGLLDNTDFPAENHRIIIKATFKSRSAFTQTSRKTILLFVEVSLTTLISLRKTIVLLLRLPSNRDQPSRKRLGQQTSVR